MTGIGKCFWARWGRGRRGATGAVAERRRASSTREGLRAHDEGEAGRLLARDLEGLGLRLSQAAALKKTVAHKQSLAWLVKSPSVVGEEWIVACLEMGHRSNVSRAVSDDRQPPTASSGAPEAPQNSAHLHGFPLFLTALE
jgi:hypothetical protein